MRRALLALLLAAALAAPALVTGGEAPAGAAPGRQDASAARLDLAAIPPWTEAGAVLAMDLRVEPAAEGLEVAVTIHDRLRSRSAWARTLEGESLGAEVGAVAVPLAGLSAGPVGTHRVSVDLGAPGAPTDAPPAGDAAAAPEATTTTSVPEGEGPPPAPLPSIPVGQEGVYPVRVDLRRADGGAVIDSLVTHLVVIDEDQPPTSLAVAWVWPLSVPVPRLPDGTVSPALQEAAAPAGRLAQLADGLAGVPDIPVTVAPDPATLDAWGALAATAVEGADPNDPAASAGQRLATLQGQSTLASRQVVTGTYSAVDLSALEEADLRGEITAQLAEGADVVNSTLGIRSDPRTYVSGGGVDQEVLGTLRQAGVDRLVLPAGELEPVFQQLTPARPFNVEGGGRAFLSASVDPGLSAVFAPPGRDAVAAPSDAEIAQRFLSGLAVVALEAPATARGVVVVPPAGWRPTTGVLVTALRGFVEHPALDAVTLDGFFSRVALDDADPVRALAADEDGRLAIRPDRIAAARQRIDSLAAMVPNDAPEPRLASRQLLLAQAARFQRRDAGPTASDYLAGVDGIIGSVLSSVRLPGGSGVTLTSERGRVPITLVNEAPHPVLVRITLTSDKLLFPDGETLDLTLGPRRSTTAQVTVESRTSGAFPMLVEVSSPDGRLSVGTFEMQVRSTAVSGVALALTVGAGLFLAGWWGNHVRKARAARRAEEAEEAAEAGGTGPDGPGGAPTPAP